MTIRTRCAGALTLAACLLGGSGAAHAGAWVDQPHPSVSGKDEYLFDTYAISATDAWAMGYRYGPVGGSFEFRTLVLHWDGFSWTQSPTLDVESAPAVNFLKGAGGSGTDDVWAVGYYTPTRQPTQALIEHWNGSHWSISPTPPGPAGGAYLDKVAAASPTDAWAVGSTNDLSTGASPLALHWNGGDWSVVAIPAVPTCVRDTELTDVAAQGPRHVFATGRCRAAGSRWQGFVLAWNGHRWSVVQGAQTLTGGTTLASVAFAGPHEAWAVGDRVFDDHDEALFLHWQEGDGWSEVPAPAGLGRATSLHAVAAAGPLRVWALGETDGASSGLTDGLALRWNGASWVRTPAGGARKLFGAAVTRNGRAWGVGLVQTSGASLIESRRDGRPSPPAAAR